MNLTQHDFDKQKNVYWKRTFWLQLLFCKKYVWKSTTLLLVKRSCSWMVYITRKLCGDSQQLDKLQAVSSMALPHVLLSLNKPTTDVNEGDRSKRTAFEVRDSDTFVCQKQNCSFLNPNSCILSENLMPLQIHSSSENTESLNKKCTWNEDDFRHKHFTVSSTVRMEAASWASFTQTARKTNLKQRISLFWKRKIPEMWLNIFKIWTWLSSGLWVLVIQTQSSSGLGPDLDSNNLVLPIILNCNIKSVSLLFTYSIHFWCHALSETF